MFILTYFSIFLIGVQPLFSFEMNNSNEILMNTQYVEKNSDSDTLFKVSIQKDSVSKSTLSLNDVRLRLESHFIQQLLTKTYQSLVLRVESNGYFQESLTGAYHGMFPRTIGALGRLFLGTGELDNLENILNYCLEAMQGNEMERIPHVIAPMDKESSLISNKDGQTQKYKILSEMDQIDGQAHVIMAWAMLALQRGETEFENKTYPIVVKLMNRSTTEPYLSIYNVPRIKPGLVCNVTLEHSRDGQYWHAYDFLTQSFICSALENMAPIPSGWRGVDKEIFKNTIDTWHRVAEIKWDGPQMTSCDWLPKSQSNQVIGKVLGWELVYSLQAQDYDRVCDLLDFIEKINSSELYEEAFNYDSISGNWILQDPGNGEQAAWWCWAMIY